MPVGEMLSRMDSAEISEWMAYFKILNTGAEKPKAADMIKAQFAKRVKRNK
jgi:hypothetical protein